MGKFTRHFTDVFIRNLKFGDQGQIDYVDETPPRSGSQGVLGIRVGKRTKTWFVRYRANGKKRRHTLGRYPDVTLSEARNRASDKLAHVYKGGDPQQDRIDHKNAPTFDDLWLEYVRYIKRTDDQKIKSGKRPRAETTK